MSEQYYYLISGLPELNTRGGLGEHQLESLQELIEENLSERDRPCFSTSSIATTTRICFLFYGSAKAYAKRLV